MPWTEKTSSASSWSERASAALEWTERKVYSGDIKFNETSITFAQASYNFLGTPSSWSEL